jgi:hypothetical protein
MMAVIVIKDKWFLVILVVKINVNGGHSYDDDEVVDVLIYTRSL